MVQFLCLRLHYWVNRFLFLDPVCLRVNPIVISFVVFSLPKQRTQSKHTKVDIREEWEDGRPGGGSGAGDVFTAAARVQQSVFD